MVSEHEVLRRVRIGMTRDEIRAILGEPDDVGAASHRFRIPRIYRYGRIELHFEPSASGGLALVYREDDSGKSYSLMI